MSHVTNRESGIKSQDLTKSISQAEFAATDAYKAQGEAVATLLITEVQRQSVSLKKFLADLVPLLYEARRAFRTAIETHLNDMREYVKANPDDSVYAKAFSSAQVRLSEAKVFSLALDAGFDPDMDQNYHTVIAQARVFRAAQASGENGAVSAAAKRGRKPTPVIEKFRKWVEDQHPSKEELQRMKEMLAVFEQVAE